MTAQYGSDEFQYFDLEWYQKPKEQRKGCWIEPFLNTEMEKRNQELQEANEQAIIAKKKKTAFLQDMMHQIRTPLNIIGGFAQVLNENYHELPDDETSNIIHMMQDNTKKFVRISRMLVAASASDDNAGL